MPDPDPDGPIVEIRSEDTVHWIRAYPLNVVVPSPTMTAYQPLKYPGRVVIDSLVTIYHAQRVQTLHEDFEEAWQAFLAATQRPADPPPGLPMFTQVYLYQARRGGSGIQHLTGLIDLSLKFMDAGTAYVWRHPEAHLHPAWQVGVADLALWFMDRQRSIPIDPDNDTKT